VAVLSDPRSVIARAVRAVPEWLIYAVGLVVPLRLYWLALSGTLSVNPVQELEHRLGLWALWMLMASLMVTPLRRFAGLNLYKLRRPLGLLAFFYVTVHLATYAVLDVQSVSRVWADIVKRPYITIGMAGFLMLMPLAATSTKETIRRMGAPRWRRLHWLIYPAILAGAVHYVLLVKGWQLQPLIYLVAILAILGVRLIPSRTRGN